MQFPQHFQRRNLPILLFLFLILSLSCQKERHLSDNSHFGKLTVTAAKAYFNSHFSLTDSFAIFSQNGKPKTGLTYLDLLQYKLPQWEKAFVRSISTGDAVQVPLKMAHFQKLVTLPNREGRVLLSDLYYLLIYNDKGGQMHVEFVELNPDTDWLFGNRERYTGNIKVRTWEGNFLKQYWFNHAGEVIRNPSISQSQDSHRATAAMRTSSAQRQPQPGCYLWADGTKCNCQSKYLLGYWDPEWCDWCTICADEYCFSPTPSDPGCLFCDDPFPPGGSSGGSYYDPNGVLNGGGGGTLGGDYTLNCNPDPNYVVPNYPPPIGTQWRQPCTAIVPVEDKYVSTYQLTDHEREVFKQIDKEDQADILNASLKDCAGTKRPAGGASFPGTKEHYLIQLDYVSRNAMGETEFQIPMIGGGRGYADIANLANGNMFEIKPKSNLGAVTAGEAEIASYLASANANCTSKLPPGVVWNPGVAYPTRQWRTNQPNVVLQAEYYAGGMIVYSYTQTADPQPIAVPQSVADKFKHLIDRLKKNWDVADVIIAEFLADPANAELVSYIKGAAIGAGVAIIVGSIIEDIATLGTGILDDFASFALAYRIIRFAVAL